MERIWQCLKVMLWLSAYAASGQAAAEHMRRCSPLSRPWGPLPLLQAAIAAGGGTACLLLLPLSR